MGDEALKLPLTAFIEGQAHLLSTDNGGRERGIVSGYRCLCWIGHVDDGHRVYNDATLYLVEGERLEPGGSGLVRLQPHNPDYWSGLTRGDRVELHEGARMVGYVDITKLFP